MIQFKGCLNNWNELPETKLPEKSVKFKEPSNTSFITLLSLFVGIIILLFIYFCVIVLCKVKKCEFSGGLFTLYGIIGVAITILPHEFLHAIWYPKEYNTNIYFVPKHLCACVWSEGSLSKKKFILMSIFPFLVFTVIPLTAWFFLPNESLCAKIALSLGSCSALVCTGDFINIFNAAVQMPKSSRTVLYKINSYWYIEE